jgi:hypothetical protein
MPFFIFNYLTLFEESTFEARGVRFESIRYTGGLFYYNISPTAIQLWIIRL